MSVLTRVLGKPARARVLQINERLDQRGDGATTFYELEVEVMPDGAPPFRATTTPRSSLHRFHFLYDEEIEVRYRGDKVVATADVDGTRKRRNKRLAREGERAWARVVDISPSGLRRDGREEMVVTYEVHPATGEPFTAVKRDLRHADPATWAPAGVAVPGQRVMFLYNPADLRDSVAIFDDGDLDPVEFERRLNAKLDAGRRAPTPLVPGLDAQRVDRTLPRSQKGVKIAEGKEDVVARLANTGARATGRVVAVEPTGRIETESRQVEWRVDYDLTPVADGAPLRIHKFESHPRDADSGPRFPRRGDHVIAYFDPTDPQGSSTIVTNPMREDPAKLAKKFEKQLGVKREPWPAGGKG